MIFISYEYVLFLVLVFALYWALRHKAAQNAMLLVGSYVFYGYVHPWFCILIAASTLADYACGLAMQWRPKRKRLWLVCSLVFNLGMLGAFKYFNFFVDNVQQLLAAVGLDFHPLFLQVTLPVGISFYTFQTLSYTIDIYKGKLEPRRNLVDFSLFVSFFPQLVAGPIERAVRLLPQIETPRRWDWDRFFAAWPLLISGFFKKLVIADNVAVFSDQVYALEHPSFFLLLAGTLAFAAQILCDFSGYTDIARGSARLLGFELIENFKAPYLAISPSDFWRRWHISFSSWIRDYLYIALGGSRVSTRWRFFLVVLTAMGLSGLWHGAAWHFVLWGLYHGLLVFAYHALGMGGRWQPKGRLQTLVAWLAMFNFTLFGWMLFRAQDIGWLWNAFAHVSPGFSGDSLLVGATIVGLVLLYVWPLWVLGGLNRFLPQTRWAHGLLYGLVLAAIVLFTQPATREFIYFQF